MRRKIWIVGLALAAFISAAITGFHSRTAHAADSVLAWQTDPGGGAPQRVLLDNDALRVTLVSYPDGFHHSGNMRRPYNTLLVYIDDGNFKLAPRPGAAPTGTAHEDSRTRIGQRAHCADPAIDCGAVGPDGYYVGQPFIPGTIYYHPKGNVTPTVTVGKAYRVLYIELKR